MHKLNHIKLESELGAFHTTQPGEVSTLCQKMHKLHHMKLESELGAFHTSQPGKVSTLCIKNAPTLKWYSSKL